jgi:membrane associated rhomboid family serine protease
MVTIIIICITCVFSITAFQNHSLFNKNLFNPYLINLNREWHRFFTHAFLHADWLHLILNMYVLYTFGSFVENYFFENVFDEKAKLFYILLYVGGILLSSFPSFERHKHDAYYNSVGASGAVSAIVFSSIVFNPTAKMGLIFLPVMIPAYIFGGLYLLYSWYMAKKANDNIGHDAHFWGAAFGLFFTIALKPALFSHFIAQINASF